MLGMNLHPELGTLDRKLADTCCAHGDKLGGVKEGREQFSHCIHRLGLQEAPDAHCRAKGFRPDNRIRVSCAESRQDLARDFQRLKPAKMQIRAYRPIKGCNVLGDLCQKGRNCLVGPDARLLG